MSDVTRQQLIGPFSQLVTMDNLPIWGAIDDDALQVIRNAGVVVANGLIVNIGDFDSLKESNVDVVEIQGPAVAIPGLIDAHTHICFGGSRERDYSLRLSGHTYQEIAAKGGGILDTVNKTRAATKDELVQLTIKRAKTLADHGVTTCEVKSGYGLDFESEIKMLQAIQEASRKQPLDLIPTCLAAHTLPPEFSSHSEYLQFIEEKLFPVLKEQQLSNRIDIFVEQNAFSVEDARKYLNSAKKQGFSLVLHADQFTTGGALLAAEVGALSADHLEQSGDKDFEALRQAGVIPIMLPGATMGLGMPFPSARDALDAGLPLVIASDWNPGSAPMGDLLLQAAVMGVQQKLTTTETLAAITQRAAKALELEDRGVLSLGKRADFAVFPCGNYQEILYYQGALKPHQLFIKGKKVLHVSY